MSIIYYLFMLMIMTSWIIFCSKNPLVLSLMILLAAMITAMSIYFFISSWFALLMFLIYIGGMMILFSYFVSLSSKDSLLMNKNLTLLLFLPLLPMILPMNSHIPQITHNLILLYSTNNLTILYCLIFILLLSMMLVVKTSNFYSGPLRPYMY